MTTETKTPYSRHHDDRFRYTSTNDECLIIELSAYLVELLGRFPYDYEVVRDLGRGLGGATDCGSALRAELVEEARVLVAVPFDHERAITFWHKLNDLPNAIRCACALRNYVYVYGRDAREQKVVDATIQIVSLRSYANQLMFADGYLFGVLQRHPSYVVKTGWTNQRS